jgi:hypothetical protein
MLGLNNLAVIFTVKFLRSHGFQIFHDRRPTGLASPDRFENVEGCSGSRATMATDNSDNKNSVMRKHPK